MQILQNVDVALQIIGEREVSLRRTLSVSRGRGAPDVRRWLGRRLVRTGAWLANEQSMQPAGAG